MGEIKIKFTESKTTHRTLNGRLITDKEWESMIKKGKFKKMSLGGKEIVGSGSFEMTTGDPAYKIYIFSEIGTGGILAKDFAKLLKDIEPQPANIYIDSSGGEVFEGMAIYNAIKNYKGKTRAYIAGLAYGTASIIACGCDEVYMKKHAYFVISEPKVYTVGIENDSAALDKISNSLAEIWAERSKKTKDEIFKMMELETWLTDCGALSGGFVDHVYE